MVIGIRGKRAAWLAGIVGVVFALAATAASWDALADRRTFDLPLRVIVLACVGAGVWLWSRGRARTGLLVTAAATAFFVRDFRATENVALFVFGFWFAYLWLGIAAHAALTWPSGRAGSRVVRALIISGYVFSVGTQIARYVDERPAPGWVSHHPPNGPWATVGSISAVVVAIAVVTTTIVRWRQSLGPERAAEPVWLVIVVVAVASATAAVGSIAGVPDGQIELIPAALALTMLVPAGLGLSAHARASGGRPTVTAAHRECRHGRTPPDSGRPARRRAARPGNGATAAGLRGPAAGRRESGLAACPRRSGLRRGRSE